MLRKSGGQDGPQTVPAAELQALLQLLLSTSGDLVVWVDANYVVRGYARGPGGWHNEHEELWSQLWTARRARQGRVEVRKVKAHEGTDMLENGEVDFTAYVLNEVADALAKRGASRAALPPDVAKDFQALENKVAKVQDRLFVLAQEWLQSLPKKVAKEAKVKKAPKKKGLWKLQSVMQASSHIIELVWGRIRCQACGLSSSAMRTTWTTVQCSGQVKHLHHTHRMDVYRGLFFCRECGYYSVRKAVGLGQPCKTRVRMTSHCRQNLARIHRGELPRGLRAWPRG